MNYDFETRGTAVALGSFDGLHIGHISVINAAKNMAARINAKPVICTFSEHPLKVLTGRTPPMLFTGEVREEAFRSTGVEVVRLDFASIKDMSPKEFFNEVLIKTLNAQGVCCGFNYTFGAKGAGTPMDMAKLCDEHGLLFCACEATELDGEVVSSTRIRKALQEGNPELAARMLGRPFRFRQQVVDGDKRGRTLGFPTINQRYDMDLVVPKFGVYASLCTVDGRSYYGATNIGVRPTVEEGEPVSSETFLLDFEGDLYGKYVDTALLKFIRPEIKFDSFDSLREQMEKDISTIRAVAAAEQPEE
ncbi:MAG: riboflavin biosynthesis protein RibF [Acutalibacteraceae bacterium]